MFDNCKFQKEKCEYSVKGEICGYNVGLNKIAAFKRCPRLAARAKRKKSSGNK